MAIISITLALFAIFVTVFLIWRRKKFTVFQKLGINGPKPNFLAGNLFELGFKGPAEALTTWKKKYGNIFGYFIGPKPVLVVGDLDDLRKILVKDFQSFMDRPVFVGGVDEEDDINQHLVSLKGKRWKDVRTILTSTFSASKMKKMSEIMNSATDELMAKISEKARKEEIFDIYELYQQLAMDVIGRTAFGIETNAQTKASNPFMKNAKGIFSISLTSPSVFLQILLPEFFRIFNFIFPILGMQGGRVPALNLLEIVGKAVKMRREDPTKKRNDLLQLMLDAEEITDDGVFSADKLTAKGDQEDDNEGTEKTNERKSGKKHKMTDAEIRANAFLFLVAGYETTSTAMAFTTHLLLKHQDAQDKIKNEVDNLIDHDILPNYDTVQQLKYLDLVLSESLRMYPPVAMFVTRVAREDYKLRDFVIPKGMQVQVPVHQLHYDEKLWDSPETFKPERFEFENRKKQESDMMAYQPFGVGPRNCIGKRFAQMEFKIAMSRILREFKLIPCEKTETGNLEILYKTVNMTPKNGIWVRALPRNS